MSNNVPYTKWLIEFDDDSNAEKGMSYLEDVTNDGGFNLVLTRNADDAIKYKSEDEAKQTLEEDWFTSQFNHLTHKFRVCEHMFNCGISAA